MIDFNKTFAIKKPSILYVDDEKDNLITFKSAFRRDFDIHLASSGKEGMALLKEKEIKLVITDQRMPEMTGIEFLQHTLNEHAHLVRIVLTGYSDVTDIISAINDGKVYAFVTKPWNKKELKMTLDNAIKQLEERVEQQKIIVDLKSEIAALKQEIRTLKSTITNHS